MLATFVIHRHGKRVLDPTVGVDDLWPRYRVVREALDRIADQIERGDQQTGTEEKGASEAVVEPEHGVIGGGPFSEQPHLGHARQGANHCQQRHFCNG